MSRETILVFLFAFVASIPHARAQTSGEIKKNEPGLVIGATVIPSQTLASGISAWSGRRLAPCSVGSA